MRCVLSNTACGKIKILWPLLNVDWIQSNVNTKSNMYTSCLWLNKRCVCIIMCCAYAVVKMSNQKFLWILLKVQWIKSNLTYYKQSFTSVNFSDHNWSHFTCLNWKSLQTTNSYLYAKRTASMNWSHSSCFPSSILVKALTKVWLNLSSNPFVWGWYAADIRWSTPVRSNRCRVTSLTNSLPWSDWIIRGLPCLVMTWKRNFATKWADLSGTAAASGHFVK